MLFAMFTNSFIFIFKLKKKQQNFLKFKKFYICIMINCKEFKNKMEITKLNIVM